MFLSLATWHVLQIRTYFIDKDTAKLKNGTSEPEPSNGNQNLKLKPNPYALGQLKGLLFFWRLCDFYWCLMFFDIFSGRFWGQKMQRTLWYGTKRQFQQKPPQTRSKWQQFACLQCSDADLNLCDCLCETTALGNLILNLKQEQIANAFFATQAYLTKTNTGSRCFSPHGQCHAASLPKNGSVWRQFCSKPCSGRYGGC